MLLTSIGWTPSLSEHFSNWMEMNMTIFLNNIFSWRRTFASFFFCFIFFSRRGERSRLVFLGEWFPYSFYHYRDLLGFVFYCFRKINLLYHHSNLFTYLFNFSCWIIYSIVSFNWIYSSYQDHSRFIIFYGVAKIHWLNCVHHLLVDSWRNSI